MNPIKNIEDFKSFILKTAQELQVKSFCFFLEIKDGNMIHHTVDFSFTHPDRLWLSKILELDAGGAALQALETKGGSVIDMRDLK